MALKMVGSRLQTPKLTRVVLPPKEVDEFYQTPAYKAWALAVKTRDRFQCQDAGPHSGPLIADHIDEVKDGGARYDVANGRTRCTACHNRKTAIARAERFAR